MANKPKLIITLTLHAESCPSLYADLEGLSPRQRAGRLRSYGEVQANLRGNWGMVAKEMVPVARDVPNGGTPILNTDSGSMVAKELGLLMGGMRSAQ